MGNKGYEWTCVAAVLGAGFWWSFVLGSLPSDQFCPSASNAVECCSCVPPPKHSCPDLVSSFYPSNTPTTTPYPTLKFNTKNLPAECYYRFIETLRHRHLESGKEVHGIRVMRNGSTVPDSERFVLVKLLNLASEEVTIAIDVVDACVVAYKAREVAYFFDGSSDVEYRNLFPEAARCQTFTFDGSYGELENVAMQTRENISLGGSQLDHARGQLWLTETFQDQAPVAEALMVIIQMISEAARFNYIVHQVSNHMIGEGFKPDVQLLWLEDNWKYISKKIQKFATEEGIFLAPFRFRDVRGRWQEFLEVTPGLINNVGLMLFICTPHQVPPSPCPFNSHLLVQTVSPRSVHVEDGETQARPVNAELTLRIIGRDFQCVTVKGGEYNNGNHLFLSSCIPDEAPEVGIQLWTLKGDGTIQSNGKCMTASELSPQSYVMIHDCHTAADPRAIIWKVWTDGSIANPHSKLVLDGHSSGDSIDLRVQQNTYGSSQGWRTTNATKPRVTPISSLDDNLCLQDINGQNVKLDPCDGQRKEQQWALYPDGSIRSVGDENKCLGFDSSYEVFLLSCKPADEVRRWVLRNDGSINNLNRSLAMEATKCKTVIANEPSGALNQRWFIDL